MSVLATDSHTAVGTLRVRGAALDPLLTRLRVQHALGAAEVRPPSLPPSAILCVRAMRDPLPGTIDVAGGGSRPPPRWERAAADALEELARGAARPAHEPTPAAAEAVLFADRAELLAQLARDWCAGTLLIHWWWRGLFPGDLAQAVVPAWLEAPTQIPAALAHLAHNGAAQAFVARLDDDAVDALLHALAAGCGVPAARFPLQPRPSDAATATPDVDPLEPPWRRWVPETGGAALGPRRELLLGVGLLLWRAPAAVRAPSFASAVADWFGAKETSFSAGNRSAGSGSDAIEFFPSPHPVPGSPETGKPPRSDAAPPNEQRASDQGAAAASPTASTDFGANGPLAGMASDDPATPMVSLDVVTHAARQHDVAAAEAIDTAFGGLFFLLNLGIALGLYGDFTMPAAPGIPLSPWDFLALLGRRLAGADLVADPVWPLLARLAGREAEDEPGADFAPDEDWRLPPAWLVPFEETAPWRWSADRERLRVVHPAGFAVLDVGRRISLRRALAREMAAYGHVHLQKAFRHNGDGASAHASPVERWLDRLLPYVRARLVQALRVDEAELPDLLLRGHARVFVSSVNFDIALSLDALPLAVRLSGLDRDPGWIPAANRVVTFRFG